MINKKKSKIFFLFIVGFFLFSLCISSNLEKSVTTENGKDNKTKKPQTSGHWNLNNILIDDSLTGVGAQNWTWAVNQDWCSGAGTWINPYIIENVTIDALNSSSGIEIKNSIKFFIIRNVTVYNASESSPEAGISLYYVDNGMLISNNCSFNNGMGIFFEYSKNNTIINNALYNNSDGITIRNSNNNTISINNVSNNNKVGIVVQSSEEIIITDNIVNNNSDRGIYLTNCNDSIIVNNTANYNYYSGFRLDKGKNNILYENTANYNIEIGIMLWNNSTNNSVLENELRFNQAYGMLLWQSDNNTIKGNKLKNNTQQGISLSVSDYNIITGNIVNNTSLNGFGVFIYNSTKNTIKENTVSNNLGDGIYLENSFNNTIEGNNATNNKGDGIYITSGSNNNTIKENTLDLNNQGINFYSNTNNVVKSNTINNSTYVGIRLINCNFTRIIENVVNYNIESGIDLSASYNNLISENTFYYNLAGINIENSNQNTIKDNKLLNNSRQGIRIIQSNFSEISGNVVEYNGWSGMNPYGIFVREGINITIAENLINDNDDDGIRLRDCENTSIYENSITYNGNFGIRLREINYSIIFKNRIENNIQYGIGITTADSQYNLFYFNFFIGNGQHAVDNGLLNNWNNTDIGNYWDNYSGVDGNNDGIGDIPHNITQIPLIQDFLPIWDTLDPVITITSPGSNDLFGSGAPSYNIDITDHYLDSYWYLMNGGSNNLISSTSGSFDQGVWNGFGTGTITITFYANDSLGQIGFASVTIRKDITPPSINIRSPNSGEVFGSSAPSFTVEIIEMNLDTLSYSLNGGISIPFTSNGTIAQSEWDALSEESVTIRFDAIDLVGNTDFAEITIVKRLAGIPGYNLTALIIVITIFIGIISLIQHKKRKNSIF